MTHSRNVGVLIGSTRKDSLNRKMANTLVAIAPAGMKLSIIEIADLPHYNQDWEGNPPPAVTAFRQAIARVDAVLFVTPEYNRSIPGVLKNAIDVGSRPYGKSVWQGKPAAVVSVSPGAIGGFGANHHLRQCFVFLDMPALQQPEAYIGGAGSMFNEAGQLTNDSTRQFMQKFLASFERWIERNLAEVPEPA